MGRCVETHVGLLFELRFDILLPWPNGAPFNHTFRMSARGHTSLVHLEPHTISNTAFRMLDGTCPLISFRYPGGSARYLESLCVGSPHNTIAFEWCTIRSSHNITRCDTNLVEPEGTMDVGRTLERVFFSYFDLLATASASPLETHETNQGLAVLGGVRGNKRSESPSLPQRSMVPVYTTLRCRWCG